MSVKANGQPCLPRHRRDGTGARLRLPIVALLLLQSLSACATFSGYATDPATDSALPADLQAGFGQAFKDEYVSEADPVQRRIVRDKIIYRQLSAYDLEFESFERGLTGNDNTFSLSADTAVLAAGATGAVSGSSTTKAALAAFTAFVTGTKTAVDKDLFYQSTLPALKAQMEAGRLQARVPIIAGLGQEDAVYPLQKALVDLGTLRAAASLGAAIAQTSQDAGARATIAQTAIFKLPAATLERKQATPTINQIKDRISSLANAQAEKMVNDMAPILQARPADIRSLVLGFDPNNRRASSGARARQFLILWVDNDLHDSASLRQWTDELDVVERQV